MSASVVSHVSQNKPPSCPGPGTPTWPGPAWLLPSLLTRLHLTQHSNCLGLLGVPQKFQVHIPLGYTCSLCLEHTCPGICSLLSPALHSGLGIKANPGLLKPAHCTPACRSQFLCFPFFTGSITGGRNTYLSVGVLTAYPVNRMERLRE